MERSPRVIQTLLRELRRRMAGRPRAPAHPPDFSPEQVELVRSVADFTMTSPERIAHLSEAVRYLHRNSLAGAIVECGVWKGGSMMAVAKTLLAIGDTTRDLHLFDTFEGLPPPGEHDRLHDGTPAAALVPKDAAWCHADEEGVRANLEGTGYPATRIHLVKGRVEETLPARAPERIALLRLDTDWYESTRHELRVLFPRLVSRGVLIIDDYGWWQGARKAVDEFFDSQSFKPLLTRLDETGRSYVKVAP